MAAIDVDRGCYNVAIFGVTGGYRVEESSAKVVRINVGNSCKLSIAIYFHFDVIYHHP